MKKLKSEEWLGRNVKVTNVRKDKIKQSRKRNHLLIWYTCTRNIFFYDIIKLNKTADNNRNTYNVNKC